MAAMAGVLQRKKFALVEEFKSITHKNVLQQKHFTFNGGKKISAKEQQVKEFPRLTQYKTHEFYSGSFLDWKEYQPLPGFVAGSSSHSSNKIRIDQILDPVPRASSQFFHVTAVGPAGSGKTTLVRWFARNAVNGGCPQLQSENRVVHLLDCRNFSKDEKLSVCEFLFTFMDHKPSDDAMEAGYEWMLSNSENVLLVVDSLDTLLYDLDDESDIIRPHDRSLPATILYNIFTGNIFSKALVLSSSREYKIKNYSGALRAHRIVSLGGFCKESIRNIVFASLQDAEAQRVWNILEIECPDLMDLCETPVFLVFTLIGLVDADTSFIPRNMTGIMVKVMESLFHSKHARAPIYRSDKELIDVLNKMKKLSFQGTKDGRVLFTEEDLERFRLTLQQITDLTVVAPARSQSTRHQRIVETEGRKNTSVAMFSHQSIQEFLTSCQLSQMLADELSSFIKHTIHQPHYSVVRRMFCGLMMNEEVFRQVSVHLLQVNHAQRVEICQLLTASMKEEFCRLLIAGAKTTGDSYIGLPLEIFRAIYESGRAKDIVPTHINEMVVQGSLMVSDLHALASSIFYCENIEGLALLESDMTHERIEKFRSILKASSLRIRSFWIDGNFVADPEACFALGQLVRERAVQFLFFQSWAESILHVFCDGLGDAKVEVLSMARDQAYYTPLFSSNVKVTPELLILLPVIKNYLHLGGHELTKRGQNILRNKLDELYPEDPVIVFGGDFLLDMWVNMTILTSRQRELKTQVIGAKGGVIHADGCSVDFPPNTFSEESEIQYLSTRQGPDVPDNYFPVSSALYCNSSKKLSKRAKVKISTWISTNNHDVMIDVLRKEDEGNWAEFKSLRLSDVRNREIEFECTGFSWFILVLRRITSWLGLVNSFAIGRMKFDRDGNFEANFMVESGNGKGDFDDTSQTRMVTLFQSVMLNNGDRVRFKFAVEPEEKFKFQRGFEEVSDFEFTVDDDFLSGSRTKSTAMVLRPSPSEEIVFNYEIQINGERIHDGSYCCKWPGKAGNSDVDDRGPSIFNQFKISKMDINGNAYFGEKDGRHDNRHMARHEREVFKDEEKELNLC